MAEFIGRIVARGSKTGIFIPFNDSTRDKSPLPLDGLYDIIETSDGRLSIVYIGDPNMPRNRLMALGLSELFNERVDAGMTKEELDCTNRRV